MDSTRTDILVEERMNRILYPEDDKDSFTHRPPYPVDRFSYPEMDGKRSNRSQALRAREMAPFYYDSEPFVQRMEERLANWRSTSSSHFAQDALEGRHPYQADCVDLASPDPASGSYITVVEEAFEKGDKSGGLESMYDSSTVRLIKNLPKFTTANSNSLDALNEWDYARSTNILNGPTTTAPSARSDDIHDSQPSAVEDMQTASAQPLNIDSTERTKLGSDKHENQKSSCCYCQCTLC